MGPSPWLRHLAAIAGYLVVTLAFAWPLPLKLSSALTGPPSGDTGVYVWNLWVFRHELISHHASPFFTREILSLTPSVPLTLHNYTTFANLIALPLIPRVGITATFNLIYLASGVLTAYAMFLLARDVTRATGESWLAGLLFGFSPALIARSTAHFSLVQAAPLPIFLLLLRRLERRGLARDAFLAGVTVAWAYTCDPYYAVYAVLLGGCYCAFKSIRVISREPSPAKTHMRQAIDSLIAVLIAVSIVIIVEGGRQFEIQGVQVSATTIYTPMLAVMILLALRAAIGTRLQCRRVTMSAALFSPRVFGVAAVACVVLMSPVIYAMRAQTNDASWIKPTIFWRSSAPGVDALAFLLPNPNHRLFGDLSRQWLTSRPGGFAENAASLTFVALCTIAIAYGLYRFQRGRLWVALAAFFAWLSLGPFVFVGGINTAVPTPWALLRYVPVIGSARMPARLSVLVMLLVSVLFAAALRRIAAAHRVQRRWVLAGVGALLLFELAPFPRTLYAASIPRMYQTIAADPRSVRVLEVPFGIRDGLSSYGDLSAATQFYQTLHEKPLIGGYLSRVPRSEVRRYRIRPLLDGLIRLGEGQSLSEHELLRIRKRGTALVERGRIGWVVVDMTRTSPDVAAFLEEVLKLVLVEEGDGRRLYRTTCCRRRERQPTERDR